MSRTNRLPESRIASQGPPEQKLLRNYLISLSQQLG